MKIGSEGLLCWPKCSTFGEDGLYADSTKENFDSDTEYGHEAQKTFAYFSFSQETYLRNSQLLFVFANQNTIMLYESI